MNQPQALLGRASSVSPSAIASGAVRMSTVAVSAADSQGLRARPGLTGGGLDPDRMFQEVMRLRPASHASGATIAALAQDLAHSALREKAAQPPVAIPPPGRVPLYNPAMDTPENFEQQRSRLATQIESLRAQGAQEPQLVGYRLRRQAEMDQMFPRQAMRLRAEEECKAAAQILRDKGAKAEEIRKYLKRKASENRLPTPPEIKAFVESRKAFAATLGSILGESAPVQGASGPAAPQSAAAQRVPQPLAPAGAPAPVRFRL